MNGKFFKLNYQGIIKIIEAENTYDAYLESVSKAFSLNIKQVKDLTGSFEDKDGDIIILKTEIDYSILLKEILKEKIKLLKITLSKDNFIETYTSSYTQSVQCTTESQDMPIQTEDVESKHVQIQTEQHSPEVKEQTCQTGFNDKIKFLKKKLKHLKQGTEKPQLTKLESLKKNARKKIKASFRQEFRLMKKKMLADLYAKSDAEIEKTFKENQEKEKAMTSSQTCKGCNANPINGTKYQCYECKDFYFCEPCEEKFSLTHGHCFIKLRPHLVEEVKQTKIRQTIDYLNTRIHNYRNQIKQMSITTTEKIAELTKFTFTNLNSTKVTKSLDVFAKNNKYIQKTTFSLKNIGNINWSTPCFLSCIDDQSTVHGKDIKISQEVKPSESITLTIAFDLSKINKEGCYISTWQLKDDKRQPFGEIFVFRIHCSYDNVLVYKEPEVIANKSNEIEYKSTDALIQSYQSFAMIIKKDYNQLVTEMQKEYGLKDDENTIMIALAMTKGNKATAYQNLCNKRNNVCYYHK